MAYLLITAGPNAGTSYHLKNCPLSGGREVTRDIQIVDPKVSRKHFRVTRQCDKFAIEEQDAKNGVFVNDKQVQSAALGDGDRIRVGATHLIFVDTDDQSKIDAIKRVHQLSAATSAPTTI